jgi:hypothetical protein
MKYLLFASSALLAILLIVSCKKSNAPAVSRWTINNQSYTATSTGFITGTTHPLIAYDTASNPQAQLQIMFGHTPASNGTYTVVSPFSTTIDSVQCAIGFLTGQTSSPTISAISQGGTVSVTISNGKVIATFNHVSMETASSNFTTLTGTLIQQ